MTSLTIAAAVLSLGACTARQKAEVTCRLKFGRDAHAIFTGGNASCYRLGGGIHVTTYTIRDGEIPPGCCHHGDTLNEVLVGRGWKAECNHMGGKPVLVGKETVCRGIDF